MIKLYGIELSRLPGRREMEDRIDPEDLRVWQEHHRTLRDDLAIRRSLAGLLLLTYGGRKGVLAYEETGRPYLRETSSDFSITHTDRLILCAIELPDSERFGRSDGVKDGGFHMPYEGARVGIDAENRSRVADSRLSDMANRWFTESEVLCFRKHPSAQTFLRIWTRKEALGKWIGKGLRDLHELDTTLAELTYGVRFYEYEKDGVCITLCLRAARTPPAGVQWLSWEELKEGF